MQRRNGHGCMHIVGSNRAEHSHEIFPVSLLSRGIKRKNRKCSIGAFLACAIFVSISVMALAASFISPTDSTSAADLCSRSKKDDEYYMVFSTGCSPFQDWQSYVFFYHAYKVEQPGKVIRIASGCTDKAAKVLKKNHEKQIKIMSKKFYLHFTPDFSGPQNYKYFNKPFGLRHWMENFLGYPNKTDLDDAIIMLLDPDMMLLRPMTHDFNNTNAFFLKDPEGKPAHTKLQHGIPFGTQYDFGTQPFTKVNLTYVAGKDSPVHYLSENDREIYYRTGPPYLATAKDMYEIVLTWCDFVPRVHQEYTHLLGEMYAYCLAAAHLKKPHQQVSSLMISNIYAKDNGLIEGWPFLDKIYPAEKACDHFEPHQLPFTLHYAQNYMLGKWFFSKYRLSPRFISCKAPLLIEPPKDIGVDYDFFVKPGEKKEYGKREPLQIPHWRARAAFTLCNVIPRMNEASIFFKDRHCDRQTANYQKKYVFHKNMDPNINNYTNYREQTFSK